MATSITITDFAGNTSRTLSSFSEASLEGNMPGGFGTGTVTLNLAPGENYDWIMPHDKIVVEVDGFKVYEGRVEDPGVVIGPEVSTMDITCNGHFARLRDDEHFHRVFVDSDITSWTADDEDDPVATTKNVKYDRLSITDFIDTQGKVSVPQLAIRTKADSGDAYYDNGDMGCWYYRLLGTQSDASCYVVPDADTYVVESDGLTYGPPGCNDPYQVTKVTERIWGLSFNYSWHLDVGGDDEFQVFLSECNDPFNGKKNWVTTDPPVNNVGVIWGPYKGLFNANITLGHAGERHIEPTQPHPVPQGGDLWRFFAQDTLSNTLTAGDQVHLGYKPAPPGADKIILTTDVVGVSGTYNWFSFETSLTQGEMADINAFYPTYTRRVFEKTLPDTDYNGPYGLVMVMKCYVDAKDGHDQAGKFFFFNLRDVHVYGFPVDYDDQDDGVSSAWWTGAEEVVRARMIVWNIIQPYFRNYYLDWGSGSTAENDDNTMQVDQFSYRDSPTDRASMLNDLNQSLGYDYGVWEDESFFWQPEDDSDANTYAIPLNSPNAQWDLRLSYDDCFNEILVEYQKMNGKTSELYLYDNQTFLPYRKRKYVSIGDTRITKDMAKSVAQMALKGHRQPVLTGTVTLSGTFTTADGKTVDAIAIRAGSFVYCSGLDHTYNTKMKIVSHKVSLRDRTNVLTFGSRYNSLDKLIARMNLQTRRRWKKALS
jgi:hypothetical protein